MNKSIEVALAKKKKKCESARETRLIIRNELRNAQRTRRKRVFKIIKIQ